MTKTTKASKTNTFRSLLQDVTCSRFASRDAALVAIDVAFERSEITLLECRKLEAAIS
jgi:hypothetical protein